MSSNAARAAILEQSLRARVSGDRAAIEAFYTDDVRAWSPAVSVTSRAELLEAFDRLDDAFSDVELDTVPLDVGGDFACVEWTATMTHSGAFAAEDSGPPTGARITVHGVAVAEFRGEQICAVRQYWDDLAVVDQLGLLGEAPDAG